MAWRFVCFLGRLERAKAKTWQWGGKEGKETDQRQNTKQDTNQQSAFTPMSRVKF